MQVASTGKRRNLTMSLLTFEHSDHRLSIQDIEEYESRLQAKLPPDYRSFLLAHNGGYPSKSDIRYNPSPKRYAWTFVGGFFALQPHSAKCIGLEPIPEVLAAELPAGCIPVASGPGSEPFVLFIAGQRIGQVWWKDLSKCDREGYPEDHLYFIAGNFSSFLSALTSKPDDEEWEGTLIQDGH